MYLWLIDFTHDKSNKFATGVENKATGDLKLMTALGIIEILFFFLMWYLKSYQDNPKRSQVLASSFETTLCPALFFWNLSSSKFQGESHVYKVGHEVNL